MKQHAKCTNKNTSTAISTRLSYTLHNEGCVEVLLLTSARHVFLLLFRNRINLARQMANFIASNCSHKVYELGSLSFELPRIIRNSQNKNESKIMHAYTRLSHLQFTMIFIFAPTLASKTILETIKPVLFVHEISC